jgi:hypothetical protein
MRVNKFVGLLLLTITIGLGISLAFNSLETYKIYYNFILLSIGLFTFLSILVYFLAKMAATSNNKYLFIYLVMFNIIFKVFASFVLIIMYNKLYQPPDRMFLMPFMFIYLTFTIFETIVMAKLAKLKPLEPNNG